MFALTEKEKNELVTNCDRLKKLKHSSSLPKVFTEYGALMAANVLKSDIADKMSIFIIRAFVKIRQLSLTHEYLHKRIDELEKNMIKSLKLFLSQLNNL